MRRRSVMAAVGFVLVAAGCGGSTGSTGSGGDSGPVGVTVLDTAGVPSAFISYGVDQGFFEKHDIDLEVQVSEGGAATIPSVVSGEVQFGGSNLISVLLGQQQGLPLRLVAPGTFATDDSNSDFSAIVVSADSPIRSPKDFEGKTIAVNTLDNISDITIKAALEKEGVDIESLRFLEVDFPEMGAALDAGRVDAAHIIEPFLTLSLDAGARPIVYPYVATKPGLQIGSYVTTSEYAASNGDVVENFAAAVADTARAVTEDPQGFRNFLPEAAEMEPALARKVVLPQFNEQSDSGSLDLLADLMVKFDVVEAKPDVSELMGE